MGLRDMFVRRIDDKEELGGESQLKQFHTAVYIPLLRFLS